MTIDQAVDPFLFPSAGSSFYLHFTPFCFVQFHLFLQLCCLSAWPQYTLRQNTANYLPNSIFNFKCKINKTCWISRNWVSIIWSRISRVWPQCGMYHEQSLSRFWELLFDGQNATEGVTTGWWPPSIKLGFISHFRKLKMLQLLSHIYEQTLAHFGIDIWHIWSMLIIKANRDKGSRPRDSS